jgi:DNA-binding HxlR family transcriptional regulator
MAEADSNKVCPSLERAFEPLGRKWAALIVHVLSGGPRYLCEVEQAIGSVSARLLAAPVKEWAEGLIRRTVRSLPRWRGCSRWTWTKTSPWASSSAA